MEKVFQVIVETFFDEDKRFNVSNFKTKESANKHAENEFNEFIKIGKLTNINKDDDESMTAFDSKYDNYVHVKVSEVEVQD